MFGYFFGYNEVVDNEIQPSYRTTRQRHLVMKQIRESKVGAFQYRCPCTTNRLLNMKYYKVHCRSQKHKIYEKYLNK